MQCVTPLIRYYKVGDSKNGKILRRSEVEQQLENDENYYRFCERKNKTPGNVYVHQCIPCGHCWSCKLNYSAQWATRIMAEVKESEHNYFITLTYDDEHIPIAETLEYNGNIYENDGTWSGTLYEKDTQTFLNSLRKHFERKGNTGIKYYYCGEYGTETLRPHYHMILMNCPLNLTQFYGTHVDKNYKAHWKSHEIEKYWTKGMIDICEVEWSCAAYVARYCMKKISDKVDKMDYINIGKVPEFVRMSRRPGIGAKYYEEHKDEIYKNDGIIMRTIKGNVGNIKPPKAWDKKLKEENPELYKKIKKSREKARERADKLTAEITDYTDKQKERLKQEKITEKGKMLPRGDM